MNNITFLRAFRIMQGLTLMEVSQKSKINICKLSYAERGVVPLSAPEYSRLSKILDIPISEIQKNESKVDPS